MFRFTIRDVLWLTALAAVSVGWWLDHSKLTSLVHQRAAEQRIAELRAKELRREVIIETLP